MKPAVHLRFFQLYWLILLPFFSYSISDCQAEESTNSHIQFMSRTWQVDEGLPQNAVQAVAQTPDGYFWAGTQGGLARFNGVTFSNFDAGNVPALKCQMISSLQVTKDGSLWIGTFGGGLARLQDGKFSHHLLASDPQANTVKTLFQTSDGVLWAGTTGGVFRYTDEHWQRFTKKEGLADNVVRSMCELDHQFWVATATGLHVWTNGALMVYPLPRDGELHFGCIFADSHTNLWLGMQDGLYCLKNGELTVYTMQDGLADNNITAIFEDHRGTLWIGSYSGLTRLTDGRFYIVRDNQGSFFDQVSSFCEDREGDVWFAGRDGLHQLRLKKFTTYARQQGLTLNNAVSLLEDREGSIWIAIWGGGLLRLKDDYVDAFSRATDFRNGLSTDTLLSLFEDRDGSLLVGADFEGGVFRMTGGKFSQLREFTNPAPRVIFRDREEKLWFGTRNGLVDWNERKTYLTNSTIRCIIQDHEGVLWVGVNDGLFRGRGDKFERVSSEPSHIPVLALYEDSDHVLWLGTGGAGLQRYNRGQLTTYNTRNGLPSDDIFSILEDDKGYLWMSSLKGVFCIDKNAINKFDRSKASKINVITYGKADGMESVQCNGVAKPAAWKARDGRLWFATTKGVAVIDPNSGLTVNSKPPPVVIEDILVDKKPITKAADIKLWPGQFPKVPLRIPAGRGELEFRYASLSYQAPERNRFKYKLEGFDADWVDAGARRVAYYGNLRPGTYRFQVAAGNNDGVWNEIGASATLILLPHYWETWWFRLLILACVIAALWFLYQMRLERLREIERLRIRIAADLHDEIGSSLGTISLLSNLMRKEAVDDSEKKDLATIHRISSQAVDSVRDIVWFINPEYNTLEDLVSRMKETVVVMMSEIHWRFDEPTGNLSRQLSLDFRQNVFLMFKETLANIVKHSHATCVEIKAAESQGIWTVQIIDNGYGFDLAAASRGNGLKNLRRRVEKLRGTLEIDSQLGGGHGTIVSFSIKCC